MSVEIAHRLASTAPLAIDLAEVAELAEAVLASEGVDGPCELSLSVVDDEEMAALNAELRGVDAPTDVLSVELERPGEGPRGEGEPCLLGDLILDPPLIERQAEGFGVSAADETRLLVIHGLLHLLGYDHEEDAEARAMGERQARLTTRATDGRIGAVSLAPHGEGERP